MTDNFPASRADSLQLEVGRNYRVTLLGGGQCHFDLSRPREIWVRPPPSPSLWTTRNDWMLVLDPIVVLRRGQPTAVRVFEEAGSTWTYVSAPPKRITFASKPEFPITVVDWD